MGPEISDRVVEIFEAAKVPIKWDVQIVGKEVDPRTNSFISRENLDSVLVRLPAFTRSSHCVQLQLRCGSFMTSCDGRARDL